MSTFKLNKYEDIMKKYNKLKRINYDRDYIDIIRKYLYETIKVYLKYSLLQNMSEKVTLNIPYPDFVSETDEFLDAGKYNVRKIIIDILQIQKYITIIKEIKETKNLPKQFNKIFRFRLYPLTKLPSHLYEKLSMEFKPNSFLWFENFNIYKQQNGWLQISYIVNKEKRRSLLKIIDTIKFIQKRIRHNLYNPKNGILFLKAKDNFVKIANGACPNPTTTQANKSVT